MSWEKLPADKAVVSLPSTKQELDNLCSIVTRSLRDVLAQRLSADSRFVIAYDAARTLSLMVVRAADYRPRSAGVHYDVDADLPGHHAQLGAESDDGARVDYRVTALGDARCIARVHDAWAAARLIVTSPFERDTQSRFGDCASLHLKSSMVVFCASSFFTFGRLGPPVMR